VFARFLNQSNNQFIVYEVDPNCQDKKKWIPSLHLRADFRSPDSAERYPLGPCHNELRRWFS
jgi:hypothetical protein